MAQPHESWSELDDEAVRAALRRLDAALRRRYGDRYARLILFGSRARGDHSPDSDADVAVVFRGQLEDRWTTKVEIIAETYQLLLDTGLYVSPWPLSEADLADPDRARNPALVRNVLADGVAP